MSLDSSVYNGKGLEVQHHAPPPAERQRGHDAPEQYLPFGSFNGVGRIVYLFNVWVYPKRTRVAISIGRPLRDGVAVASSDG